MKNELLQQAVELTRECLERYWQRDYEFALEHCANDVTWIGALQSQFMQGIDKVREDFEAVNKELKPCHLMSQEFLVSNNAANVCTVNGRYLVTTDECVEYFLQAMQRCSFVWENVGGELQIKVIHISNPLGEMKVAGKEKFVNTMGKMAGIYLKRHVKSLNDTTRIVGTDVDGIIHVLNRSEVLYACALYKHCAVHTINGDIELRIKFSDFLEQAGEIFSAVHRSYAVNLSHIKEIKPYDVIMTDGSAVPIPIRKYAQIKDMLVKQCFE